ncbi:P-loop containing nucleoside triphosphate hydrolase protein, partial [Jimgerdemannia flammicorona]
VHRARSVDIPGDQEAERGPQVQDLRADQGDGGDAGAGSEAETEIRYPHQHAVAARACDTAGTDGTKPVLQRVPIATSYFLRNYHPPPLSPYPSSVRHLILDEADKLLDLGFLTQTDEIFAACTHPHLQKSLFSATIPAGIESLASTVMRSPLRVVIGSKNAATETITQRLVYVGAEEGKLIAVRQMIQAGKLRPPVLVFVQSIERAKELFHELVYDGINVDVIHSERTKAQRDAVVEGFRAGKIWVLIATELMARGLDFKGVNLVVNYDFPQTVQSYIHRIGEYWNWINRLSGGHGVCRISGVGMTHFLRTSRGLSGRTGRAGRAGEAVTYFTRDDVQYLKRVRVRCAGLDADSQETRNLKQRPVERKTINTMSSYDKKRIAHKREIVANQKKRKAEAEGAEDEETPRKKSKWVVEGERKEMEKEGGRVG